MDSVCLYLFLCASNEKLMKWPIWHITTINQIHTQMHTHTYKNPLTKRPADEKSLSHKNTAKQKNCLGRCLHALNVQKCGHALHFLSGISGQVNVFLCGSECCGPLWPLCWKNRPLDYSHKMVKMEQQGSRERVMGGDRSKTKRFKSWCIPFGAILTAHIRPRQTDAY